MEEMRRQFLQSKSVQQPTLSYLSFIHQIYKVILFDMRTDSHSRIAWNWFYRTAKHIYIYIYMRTRIIGKQCIDIR